MESEFIRTIAERRGQIPLTRSLLVGISGIDASGKGCKTAKLEEFLAQKGFRVANINVDGWLNLPAVRFSQTNPAANFYENAIRFAEMFEQLILPLKHMRSIELRADLVEETASEFHPHDYRFREIDIILLEGIFLFKNEFKANFDLRIWIECPFEIALERALARAQEDLPPEETRAAYEMFYFPAQRLHFASDNPRESADLLWFNG